jgi:hypothetical protein
MDRVLCTELLKLECVKAVIAAVRADKIVGAGSCSAIDEAHDDEEIVDEYILEKLSTTGRCPTPAQVVAAARRDHKIWTSHGEEIRGW